MVCNIKERSLWLLNQGFSPKETAHLLGGTECSIVQWKSNSRAHGSVTRPHHPIQDRLPRLSSKIREDLIALIKESPDMYLNEILDWLAIAHDAAILKSQLDHTLQQCSITYKRMTHAAQERDEEERDSWCQEHQLRRFGSRDGNSSTTDL
ncbi:hypothetical protein PM082_022032 [Marasmius tenuissimus]|nr:hypothetical protein PM082_022032 [Marasmius tenuissimus]